MNAPLTFFISVHQTSAGKSSQSAQTDRIKGSVLMCAAPITQTLKPDDLLVIIGIIRK